MDNKKFIESLIGSESHPIDMPEWDEVKQMAKGDLPTCVDCGRDDIRMVSNSMAYCTHCRMKYNKVDGSWEYWVRGKNEAEI